MVLWMVDEHGRFMLIEGESLPCLELEKDSILGRPIEEVYHHLPKIVQAIRHALEGKTEEGEFSYKEETWTYRTYPSRDSEDKITGAVGLVFDITPQQERIRRQESLEKLSSSLKEVRSLTAMPPVILESVQEIFHSDRGIVISQTKATQGLTIEAASGAWKQLKGQTLSASPLSGLTPQMDLILDSGQPLLQSFEADPVSGEHPSLQTAGVPLTGENRIEGLVLLGRGQAFQDKDIQLLANLADLAGNALHREAQHERTERRLQRISALHAIDRAITGSFDLQVTLDVLLNQVISQLEIDAVSIYLYNPNLNVLEFANSRGFRTQVHPQDQLSSGDGLPWLPIEKRGLVRIPDLNHASQKISRSYLLDQEHFVSYYGFPLIVKGEIKGILEIFHRQPLFAENEWIDFYKTLATQAAIAIDNAALVENLRQSNLKLDLAYHATLEGWVRALDLRDKETEGHTQRVTKRTEKLAQAMGVSGEALVHLRRGALLHDIGKLGIPDEILNKPGPLNHEEWDLMREHPEYARKMLSQIEFLHPALTIPYHHHENWDGSGYPQGLKGKQIPLEARIFAVIDVWDALTSNRPYRGAWSEEKAIQYILDQSGLQFDPKVIETWKEVFEIPDRLKSSPVPDR